MNGKTKIADLTVNEFCELMREIHQDEIQSMRGFRYTFSWDRAKQHAPGCDCNNCCQERAYAIGANPSFASGFGG